MKKKQQHKEHKVDIFISGRSLRDVSSGVIKALLAGEVDVKINGRSIGPRRIWNGVKRRSLAKVRTVPQLARWLQGWPGMHVNPADVAKWYRHHGKKVTIVIPSYNDYPLLKACIKSIHKTTSKKRVTIIVVDDFAQPDSRKQLKELEGGNVTVVYREQNGGFAQAVNTGMRAANKRHDIILLNSDIVAKKGWLRALQFGAYEFDGQAGIVGAKLLYPDGRIQYAGTHRNLGAPDWFDHYYRFKPSNYPPANVPFHTIGVTGACMYIKRALINKIGYMDEKFGMAFEDMDYSIRAWNAGFRSLYFPLATLTHHESITRGKQQGKRELKAKDYFWKKWGDWFDNRSVTNEKGQVKVIYVIPDTGVGGGARLIFEHLNRLRERGFDTHLFSLSKGPDWFDLKAEVHTFKDYDDLIKVLAGEDAIKVATWWETGLAVWLGSVVKGAPVFYVQDIESSYYPHDLVMQETVHSYYRKEFHYLTISEYNKQMLAGFGVDALNIRCGIDFATYRPLKGVKRRNNVIIAAGRSNPLKNFSFTLKAWEGMHPQPVLSLYGIEPQLTEGKKNVEYHVKPTDEKINRLYNEATVFVQTSRHEGLCLPALEAMAAGTPVVTTDSHGNRDYCVDGDNCLMVEQDDVEELRTALSRVLTDKVLQAKLRQAGYKTVKHYDWPKIIDTLETFYKGIAKSGGRKD